MKTTQAMRERYRMKAEHEAIGASALATLLMLDDIDALRAALLKAVTTLEIYQQRDELLTREMECIKGGCSKPYSGARDALFDAPNTPDGTAAENARRALDEEKQ